MALPSKDQAPQETLGQNFEGEIPAGLTRQHVLDAMQGWDIGNKFGFGDSTDYDVLFEGKRYPPKALVGIATKPIIGRPLKPSEFPSGKGSACFRVLKQ